ncbi:hypothetical protein IC762_05240 [Bradyrhizobium genosp. L]|uniref:hypothetical protein n=1 Tax=Bradyrhizobium genosp. L TaxID=83637 RepID=UPI0018A2A236|nr:hypothetical protein IC762_05240 [Bradyrhizobium genosp. L]
MSIVVCMSVGVALDDELDDEPAADCRSALSEESMLVSAVESALASAELTVPDVTSDWSSACNLCKGEL